MDLNVHTEELTTIYLDSEDDEDPLRLSPPSSPTLSSSSLLKNQVRQRFADLRNNKTRISSEAAVVKITRVRPKKIGDVGIKASQVIEIIDLDDDSPPRNAPNCVPSLPSTPTTSSPNGVKNGSTKSNCSFLNGCNGSSLSPVVPSSLKPSRSISGDNIPVIASNSIGLGREENELPTRKRHILHATNQVIAVASTSKECSKFISSVSSPSKKCRLAREENSSTVVSNFKIGSLDREESKLPRKEGLGLNATNNVTAIASTSKECSKFISISSSSKKSRSSREENAPVVASTFNSSRLGKEESVPAVPSPSNARGLRSEGDNSAITSTYNASRPGREGNAPVLPSPSKEKGLMQEQMNPGCLSLLNKIRPGKEEIDSTMSKLVECNATNRNVFQKFIEICLACDNSSDLKEIHRKKTIRYYSDLHPEYEESDIFRSLLEENILIMAKNPASVFTCLVNVHAEMKRKRAVANSLKKHSAKIPPMRAPHPAVDVNSVSTLSVHEEDGELKSTGIETNEDSKEERKKKKTEQHIKNLEKALRQCNLRIKHLEEAEVDWDDDEDSSYLKMQRYRRRCIDIHRKIVELKGVRDEAIKRRPRVACASTNPHVRSAIERFVFINATFPDFNDIIKIYKEASPGLRPSELIFEAEKTFKEIGDQIQRDRQVYDWNLACSFLDHTSDPAENDPELKAQLQRNKQLGDSKLEEVLASFTRKQYEQNLEPTEVPDELAAATDDDDDDEDEEEEDKGLSDDDLRAGSIDFGADASDSDADSKRDPSSDVSKTQSQDVQVEKDSKKDQKGLAENSPETKSSEWSSKIKKKATGSLRSYTKNPKKKVSQNVFPIKVNPLTPPKMKQKLRTLLPAPAPDALPAPTLLPIQIIMPAQTALLSLSPLPLQSQLTFKAENVVNRKYQLEALTNYLEMKYQMDPSAINAKCVTSSSIEATSLEQPASPSGVAADSTESKAGCRYEKTGSDPEVTSTSVDGDLAVESQANECDGIVSGPAICIKTSQIESKTLDTRKLLASGDSSGKTHIASDNLSTKSQITSGDFAAKSILASDYCGEKSKGTGHKPSFSEVHSSYVLGKNGEQMEWDLKEELVVEEDGVVVEEAVQGEDVVSLNESTVDLEDWENMIMPTIVAKEVLLVFTNAEGETQGTEIETSAEVDLDSSDEFLQIPPKIKTYQRKGRSIVPSINELTVDLQSEPAELKPNLCERVISSPPPMVMIDRTSMGIPLVIENIDSVMHSAASSSSTSTVVDCGGSKNLQAPKPLKITCKSKDQENVPPRMIQADRPASKGITYAVRSKPEIRGSVEIAKAGKDDLTVSDAGSSHSLGLSEAVGTLESEVVTLATSVDRTVQVLPTQPCLSDALPCKPTARKTISGRGFIITTKKPIEQSEPCLKVTRISKQYAKPKAVETESEKTTRKPTARKSFPSEPGGSLLQDKSWMIEELKVETILSSAGEDSVKSSAIKMTEPDVILIDSD